MSIRKMLTLLVSLVAFAGCGDKDAEETGHSDDEHGEDHDDHDHD